MVVGTLFPDDKLIDDKLKEKGKGLRDHLDKKDPLYHNLGEGYS